MTPKRPKKYYRSGLSQPQLFAKFAASQREVDYLTDVLTRINKVILYALANSKSGGGNLC